MLERKQNEIISECWRTREGELIDPAILASFSDQRLAFSSLSLASIHQSFILITNHNNPGQPIVVSFLLRT